MVRSILWHTLDILSLLNECNIREACMMTLTTLAAAHQPPKRSFRDSRSVCTVWRATPQIPQETNHQHDKNSHFDFTPGKQIGATNQIHRHTQTRNKPTSLKTRSVECQTSQRPGHEMAKAVSGQKYIVAYFGYTVTP